MSRQSARLGPGIAKMAEAIGRTGKLRLPTLAFPIDVVVHDVRLVYGRLDYLVGPPSGEVVDCTWLEASRVTLNEED